MTMEKLIIDVDTGVDDAQAIILALSKPDVEVLGITCVAGNCKVDQVCINTLKVLTVCKRLDIPVYKGSSKPLVGEGFPDEDSDCLGDADLKIPVDLDKLQEQHAVSAIVDLVNRYPGQINLVALAPLTNIALAIRQDPDLGKKLKKVTIMGGNIEGRGSWFMCAEYNFGSDPDAAKVVLTELQCPITLVPWENTLTEATGQPWEWFDKWIETDTSVGHFNKAITKDTVKSQKARKKSIYRSCDLLAMVCALDPSLIQETTDVYATVELNGTYTRGMLVVDWRNSLKQQPNVTIVKSIDIQKARLLYDQMLK